MHRMIVRALAIGALLLTLGAAVPSAPALAGQGGGGHLAIFDDLAEPVVPVGTCAFVFDSANNEYVVARRVGNGGIRQHTQHGHPPDKCEDRGAV